MSIINEDNQNEKVLDGLYVDEEATEETSQQEGAPAQAETSPAEEDVLPEKLRGKSVEELADMYLNLEKEKGRLANEVGTYRQLAEELERKKREDLQAQETQALAYSSAQQPRQTEEAESVDFNSLLEDPEGAVSKVLDKKLSSTLSQYQKELQELKSQMSSQTFEKKHPDYLEIAQSEDFRNWVQQSVFRTDAVRKVQQGDINTADLLLQEYKASRNQASASSSTNVDKLGLETRGAASAGTVGSVGSSTKKLSREKIRQIQMTDPVTYNSDEFQAALLKAYREGRVE